MQGLMRRLCSFSAYKMLLALLSILSRPAKDQCQKLHWQNLHKIDISSWSGKN
uniref:Uncharacterized protein n=1 Tax=Rhizophora mucronata TaxID=61149 RepID=A0A2P2MN65_RHIMU